MGFVKISDLVALDEIRELLEVDAKPLDKKSQEEDSADRFWEAAFSAPDIVHPEIEQDDEEEKTDEED